MGRPKPSGSREVRGHKAKAQSLASVIQETTEKNRKIVNDSTAVHPRSREFDSVKSGLAFAAGRRHRLDTVERRVSRLSQRLLGSGHWEWKP